MTFGWNLVLVSLLTHYFLSMDHTLQQMFICATISGAVFERNISLTDLDINKQQQGKKKYHK